MTDSKRPNRLINETSPYLLQHAHNPVDWWPWCDEAFARAKADDKPVLLSIGYSTCHWCHVMAHESFENDVIAQMLNAHFICIKVDREERPDVDSIYMRVCQALTGSGGWPLTVFLTPARMPFFAGTYFPPAARHGSIGFYELLGAIHEKWNTARVELLSSADKIAAFVRQSEGTADERNEGAVQQGYDYLVATYDTAYGGFGRAPKFPSPHNLLFLLKYHAVTNEERALDMATHTLKCMYRGGIFDHIGYGFSRYSTDNIWLAPHFEKMLYDNALLTLAYLNAYEVTGNILYKEVFEKVIRYVLCELQSPQGGFYCAQDADSEGVEGKYYLFTPDEVASVLGEENAARFNARYDITPTGNFEGKSIPNLIKSNEATLDDLLPSLYAYRKARYKLHLDDKCLTSWNGLMIAALAQAYRLTDERAYLAAAKAAVRFIDENLSQDAYLYTSYRDGKRSTQGFLDDYAFYLFGLLSLYNATREACYLSRATALMDNALERFFDHEQGGFYLYANDGEPLLLRPKETYDGALPSGNSMMTYVLVLLTHLTDAPQYLDALDAHMRFMDAQIAAQPMAHCFYLYALLVYAHPPQKIVCVLAPGDDAEHVRARLPADALAVVYESATATYALKNDKTTYYICEGNACRPPINELP